MFHLRKDALFLLLVFIINTVPLWAINGKGTLTGRILDTKTKQPIGNVVVTVTRDSAIFSAITDDAGNFSIPNLPAGEYQIKTERVGYKTGNLPAVSIKPDTPTILTLELFAEPIPLRGITVTEKQLPISPIAKRGRIFMQTQIADSKNWQSVVSTVPGVVSNPFGQMHVRGDHNLITFSLDEMLLPVSPEGQLGPLIDPRFLSDINVESGSYDPSLSGQLGAVVELVPLQSSLPSQFEFEPGFGDHSQREFLGTWTGRSDDDSWTYFVGAQSGHTSLRLEPPHPSFETLNNAGDDSSGFFHVMHIVGENHFGFGIGRQITDFGIPNTPSAQSAGVNQHERNANNFAVMSWRRVWSSDFESQLGFSWLQANQAVINNGIFTPYILANPITMPNANAAGLSANPTDVGSPYLPVINRKNSQFLLSFALRQKISDQNHLEFGGRANFIPYQDVYDILDAGGSGLLPSSHVLLSLKRTGFNGQLFLNDHFTFRKQLHVDVGFNAARFSDGLQTQTSQLNPTLNLAYSLSPTQIIRFSYNHVFNVPPLEADAGGNLALPENADTFELNYERHFTSEIKFGLAGYVKNLRNQIDGALLLPQSNIPLFTPRNFSKSLDDGIEVSLHTEYKTGWNGFLDYANALAKSVAAPTSPSVFLDHDQRNTLTFGTSYSWKNGFYISKDFQYGSGFPQAIAQIYAMDNVYPFGITGRVSHFILNLSIGYKPSLIAGRENSPIGFSIVVLNLFNKKQNLNFISDFTGTRFIKEREIFVNASSQF